MRCIWTGVEANVVSRNLVEAERLLSVAVWGTMKRWSMINSLLSVANAGYPHASDVIAQRNAEWAKQPTIKDIFPEDDTERLADEQTKRCLTDAQYAVDAAALVFAHSIVDSMTYEYCRVSATARPSDWEDRLANKTVALGEAKQKPYDQLLREKLEAHLQELERASLLQKADRILAICQPPPGWLPKELKKVYEYNRDLLKMVDELRHKIVHGPSNVGAFGDIHSHVFYLQMTLMYLGGMIQERHSIRVNPAYVFQDSAE